MNRTKKLSNKKLDLSDRLSIEVGICADQDFNQIGLKIGRHPVTIAREVKNNRTLIYGSYPYGNDCKYASRCG